MNELGGKARFALRRLKHPLTIYALCLTILSSKTWLTSAAVGVDVVITNFITTTLILCTWICQRGEDVTKKTQLRSMQYQTIDIRSLAIKAKRALAIGE